MSAFECRIDAGVATFVIDNPPQNRLSFAVIRGFAEAVQKVHGHPDVRVVVVRAITEAGDPAAATREFARRLAG